MRESAYQPVNFGKLDIEAEAQGAVVGKLIGESHTGEEKQSLASGSEVVNQLLSKREARLEIERAYLSWADDAKPLLPGHRSVINHSPIGGSERRCTYRPNGSGRTAAGIFNLDAHGDWTSSMCPKGLNEFDSQPRPLGMLVGLPRQSKLAASQPPEKEDSSYISCGRNSACYRGPLRPIAVGVLFLVSWGARSCLSSSLGSVIGG